MLSTHFGPSADLPYGVVWLACGLAAASFLMLLFEIRRRERGGLWIAITGLAAVSMLLASVLRPARVLARETRVGARVVILADTSRSMALPGDDGRPRREALERAIAGVKAAAPDARFVVLGFGEGAPRPLSDGPPDTRARHSDLGTALRFLAASPDERPAAVVVVSDGRLDDPPEGATTEALRAMAPDWRIPMSTIATAERAPADASVRRVSAAGAAVAHVPLPLRVEIGCDGGLRCESLPVTARELRDDGSSTVLASGVAHVKDGRATLDLTITLEQAGVRIVEVAIDAPEGDTIAANDRRWISFAVSRERIRVLHVAGRPTNDVRTFRQWLKSDASVDIVAFFILRTQTDDARASQDELALIPFPVDELFTEHLPSFDAVVLQDFDAQPYGLEKYLGNIERYVQGGGGLVMVGGQNSFVGGGYAGTALARVLPVDLDGSASATGSDTSPFVPEWTPEGRVAPLLAPLRDVLGDDLPEMPGANVLGNVRPGGMVLWAHPTRTTPSGAKMPVLAIGEAGDGRTVALGLDGTWVLKFSDLGAKTGGRGHGALWDGLLGWLMRDPRFEVAQMTVPLGCTAGEAATLEAHLLPAPSAGPVQKVDLEIARLDRNETLRHVSRERSPEASAIEFALPALEAGAYSARLRMPGGVTARYDFVCEEGGDEWADSRPDPDRLRAIANSNGGVYARWADAGSIHVPKPTVVNAERHVMPIAPAWVWSLAAAASLGVHWIARRRGGLS